MTRNGQGRAGVAALLLLVLAAPSCGGDGRAELCTLLQSDSAPARTYALMRLAAAGREEDFHLVAGRLADPDERVRLAAVRALIRMDDVAAEPLLLKALAGAEARERKAILRWLVETRPEGGQEALVALTRRGPPGAWRDAWVALGRLGAIDALKPLLADLRSDEPHPETLAALGSLARAVGHARLWEGFREAPIPALVPVFEAWGPPAAGPLIELLESDESSEDLRVALLAALGRVAPGRALPVLRKALLEGSERLQRAAVGSLAARRDEAAARILLEALGAERCVIQDEVASALARLGDRVPGEALAAALRDPQRRGATLALLARRGDRRSLKLAEPLVDSDDLTVRAGVAKVIGASGDADQLAPLVRLARDEDLAVQLAARRALARLLAALLDGSKRDDEVAGLDDGGPTLALAAEAMQTALEDDQDALALDAARALLLLAERLPGPAGLSDTTTRAMVAARLGPLVGRGGEVEASAMALLARSRAARAEDTLRQEFRQAVTWMARAVPPAADDEHALPMPCPEALARARERARERRAGAVSPERMARLVAAMAEHGGTGFVEDTTRLLQSPTSSNPAARRAAALVLVDLARPTVPACAVAEGFDREGDEVTRRLMIHALGRCTGEESRLVLLRAASRIPLRDPYLDPVALDALFRDGPAAVLEALAGGDEAVRGGALAALAQLRDPSALEALTGEDPTTLEALARAVRPFGDDHEAHLRADLTRVLGLLIRATEDDRDLDLLVALADDEDPDVRVNALQAIFASTGERRREELVARIEHLVVDPERSVRGALAQGLAGWDLEAADERLVLLVADEERAVCEIATRGIAAHGRERFALSLLDAAEAGPRDVSLAAVSGLNSMQAPSAVGALVTLLERSDDPQVRGAAIEALGQPSRGAPAAAALRRQLYAGPAELRWRALEGLLRIDGVASGPGISTASDAEVEPAASTPDERGESAGRLDETAALLADVPAPPTALRVRDAENDSGRSLELSWRPSVDDPQVSGAAAAGAPLVYRVLRSRSVDGPYHSVAELPAGTRRFRDDRPGLTDGVPYHYRVRAARGPLSSLSAVSVAAVSAGQWFHTGRVAVLVAVLLFSMLVVLFVRAARRSPEKLYVRPLPGLQALEEAIGRATEMGRPVLYSTGLGEISDIGTLASISILASVSRTAAEYGARLRVPCRDPVVFAATQEAVEEGCLAAGRPDAYDPADVFFVAGRQFAYAAAVSGIMIREQTAANLFVGLFYAEALLLAETGATTGAIQIAATDRVTQLPFFITSCDYTLIGEELYAAGAYLGRDPALLGGLKAQDWTKALLMAFLGAGALLAGLAAVGLPWFDSIKQGLLSLLGSS